MKKFLLVLGALGASAAFGPAPAIAQTGTASYSGVLTVMWGDPKPGVLTGATRFELTLPDGTAHPLEIKPDQQNGAIQYFGKHVTVTGATNSAAGAGASTIAVESINSAEPDNKGAVTPSATVTRKVLFVLLKFKGNSAQTHPVQFYKDLTNPQNPPSGSPTPATINGFFNKTSWGYLQWKGDVAGNKWFTLPKTKTGYANCGWSGVCADLTGLRNDALALVTGAGVDYTTYDNINFVVNDDLDCCAWGGSFNNGAKSFGQTFEPPWSQEAGTYVHEMGHSIGLPHSGWRYYAYDSHHDQMSRGNPANVVVCGSYKSTNDGGATDNIGCTEPGAGYIAAHKDYLGWIPAANKKTVSSKKTVTYTIEAEALPLGSKIKMVKLCIAGKPCTGSTARFITVEVKMKVAKYENGLPSEGVVIHDVQMNRPATPPSTANTCFFNNQSGWAMPYDATPGDFTGYPTCSPEDTAGAGLENMPYVVGKKWSNSTFGLSVQVMSKTSTTYTVQVKRTK